jgi:hypothetical protein
MLWNANLDKSAPKRQSKAELQKELKKWEEERKVKKKKPIVDDSYLVRRYRSQNAGVVDGLRTI